MFITDDERDGIRIHLSLECRRYGISLPIALKDFCGLMTVYGYTQINVFIEARTSQGIKALDIPLSDIIPRMLVSPDMDYIIQESIDYIKSLLFKGKGANEKLTKVWPSIKQVD